MAQDAPHGGLSRICGLFSPQKLARFKELLEKPARLKSGWPDNEDMESESVEGFVVSFGESSCHSRGVMRDIKERIDDVDDKIIDGLQRINEQLREFVWDTIGSSENKLAGKDDALKAMVAALKEEINELKGELKIFKAIIGNGMLASNLK
ncbi:hypothetical protein J1N35_037911 [Gossypium stocksii]|uniref:Uncharacterized protein n=1 Tax=Gossypium stocksii TaxID=47602 RepID=A0A9D3UKX5_9ROSI|nr:hypothetical protein J1N35_037911 [Gossypium stocksii]